MWNLNKMIQVNLFTKQKQTHKYRKQTYFPKNRRGAQEEVNQEFGVNINTLLYIKYINSKVILYSTENYIKQLIIIYNGKEYEKNIYLYTI